MLTIEDFVKRLPSGAADEVWSTIRILTHVSAYPVDAGTAASFLCHALNEINKVHGTSLRVTAAVAINSGVEFVAVISNGNGRRSTNALDVLNLEGPLYKDCAKIVLAAPNGGDPDVARQIDGMVTDYMCDGELPSSFERALVRTHGGPRLVERD